MTDTITATTERAEDQRKTLIIKPKFQHKMLLEVVLITFILVNTIVTIGYFLMDSLAGAYHLKETLSLIIASIEIVGFALIYYLNLKSSNRIAGPVYNLERSLLSVESGDFMTVMKTRDTDEFQEMSEQFNSTVESLRCRINRIQFLADQVNNNRSNDAVMDELINELAWFNTHSATDSNQSNHAL